MKRTKTHAKARKGDKVVYRASTWTVADRSFNGVQSYYTLKSGRGRKARTAVVRSDGFSR